MRDIKTCLSKVSIFLFIVGMVFTIQAFSNGISFAAVNSEDLAPIVGEQLHFGEVGVNPATGNFSISFLDMQGPAAGFSVKFERTYNSKNKNAIGPMGRDWSFSFDSMVDFYPSTAIAKLPNGRVESFMKVDGIYKSENSQSKLVKKNLTQYTLTTKDQTVYTYTSNDLYEGYRLTKIEDRNGNTLSVIRGSESVYDYSNPAITAIEDGHGRRYSIDYEYWFSDLMKITITDEATSRYATLSYNYGRLFQSNDPEGNITRYYYDNEGLLNEIKDEGNNRLIYLEYDHTDKNRGRVNKVTDVYGNVYTYQYNENEGKTTVTDSNGRESIYWYDSSMYVTKTQYPDGTVKTLAYGQDGANAKHLYTPGSQYETYTLHRELVAFNNKVYTIGGITSFGGVFSGYDPVYDPQIYPYNLQTGKAETTARMSVGRYSVEAIGSNGKLYIMGGKKLDYVSSYGVRYDKDATEVDRYDPATNQCVKVSDMPSDCKAEGLVELDGKIYVLGESTSNYIYVYNTQNNTWTKVNTAKPAGLPTASNVVTINGKAYIGGKGNIYIYDMVSNSWSQVPGVSCAYIKKTMAINGKLYALVAKEQGSSTFTFMEYDPVEGQWREKYDTSAVDSENVSMDALGQKLYGILPVYVVEHFENGNSYTTEYLQIREYDMLANRLGLIQSTTDRNGNTTRYEYDGRGNMTKIINPDNTTREFQYDGKDNLISEKDAKGNYTYYIYDANKINLVKKVQPLNGTDNYELNPDPSKYAITSYTYFPNGSRQVNGLVQTVTDPGGNVTTYDYHPQGYLKSITDRETAGETAFEYNNIGLKTKVTTPEGFVTEYKYDNNGQLERTILHGGETTRVVYDSQGRKVKEVLPKAYDPALDDLAGHTYDSGNTTSNYTRIEYYPSGKVSKVTDAEGYVTEYTYDMYGNLQTEKKHNGSVYIYEYDNLNRLVKVYFKANATEPDTSKVILEEYAYLTLEKPEGELYHKLQKIHTRYLDDSGEVAVTTDTYDYAGRLLEQQKPNGAMDTYQYDANGNVERSTAGFAQNDSYSNYDPMGRLSEKWTAAEMAGGVTKYVYTKYIYDKKGNLKENWIGKGKVANGQIPVTFYKQYYDYYLDGKKKSVIGTNGAKTEYAYDEDGNLNKEVVHVDGSTTRTVEYKNNYWGKPDERKVWVGQGDIYGYTFGDTTDVLLVTKYGYDKNGNLETEEACGTQEGVVERKITKDYDYLNRVKIVNQPELDKDGKEVDVTTETTYNFQGNPKTIKDPEGNITVYSYNQRGLLETVKNTVTGQQGELVELYTGYGYDRAGRKVKEVSPGNYDAAKTISQMNRSEYTYDRMGQVVLKEYVGTGLVVNPDTYQLVETPVARTPISAYQYDLNGNVVKELDALGYEAGTGTTVAEKVSTGYGAEYKYNLMGQKVEMLDPEAKAKGASFSVKYTYDTLGRNIAETDARGVVKRSIYDDANRTLTTTLQEGPQSEAKVLGVQETNLAGDAIAVYDGNGNKTQYIYNALGKVRKVIPPGDGTIIPNITIYQYDVLGNVKVRKDREGTVDLFTYDRHGRVLSHTQQRENGSGAITTSTVYDRNGNKRFETDANNVTKEYIYDELNRVKEVKWAVSDVYGNVYGNVTHKSIKYGYDKNGNVVAETDWRGNTYTNTYDPLNRLVQKSDPYTAIEKIEYNRNNVQVKSYDALDKFTEYEYDKNNRVTATIDPEGHRTTQSYDTVGNIETQTDGRGNTTTYTYDGMGQLVSVVNAKGERTSYTYDNNGNLLTQEDGNGHTTTFKYNVANKVTKRVDHGGILADGSLDPAKTESYMYYANGSLQSKTDRNGQVARYTYDCHGRLITKQVGSTSTSYRYDGNGNVLVVDNGVETITRTYDEENRVKTKHVSNIGMMVFQYDVVANMPGGYTAEVSIDPKGNQVKRVYDKAGRLKSVEAGDQTTTYEYYPNGSRHWVQYHDGSKAVYTYTDDGLLETLANYRMEDGQLAVMDSYSYTYDAAHNQKTKTEMANGVSKGTTEYSYDALNRLETVAGPNGRATAYKYDAAGNRKEETTTENGTTTSNLYYYNEQNRLQNIKTIQGQTVKFTLYMHDNNGNMVCKMEEAFEQDATGGIALSISTLAQASDVTLYTYDALNQLVGVSTKGKEVSYVYNAEGYRVAKGEAGQVTTRYFYEGDKVVLELDGDGNQAATNVYGSNLISRTVDGQKLYYFYNGHADVTALVDGDGQLVGIYDYDEFGNVVLAPRYGDVSGDKRITVTDYAMIRDYNNGTLAAFFVPCGEVVADVDGDGTLTTADEDLVRDYVLGRISNFPADKNGDGLVNEDNPYGYSGYQYDGETGLYYLNARMYDPTIARFLQEDTYRGEQNDPLSLNLYTYVMNNPLIYWDPTGHWAEDDKYFSQDTQGKLIALTSAWFAAETPDEKQKIEDQATTIRRIAKKDPKDRVNKDTLVQIFKTSAQQFDFNWLVSQSLRDKKGISEEEWKGITDIIDVTFTKTTTVDNKSIQGMTITTNNYLTKIGKSDISVELKTAKVDNISSTGITTSITNHYSAYVFYNTARESRGYDERQKLAAFYGISEADIGIAEVNGANDLKEAWNSMGDEDNIKAVAIHTHGSHESLSFEDRSGNWGTEMSASKIKSDLEEKNVGVTFIAGCNSGHLNHKNSNPAAQFAKKVKGGKVIATDGTNSNGPRFLSLLGSIEFDSLNDDSFKAKIPEGSSTRDNEGWIVYQDTGGSVTTSDSLGKELTLSQMLEKVSQMK